MVKVQHRSYGNSRTLILDRWFDFAKQAPAEGISNAAVSQFSPLGKLPN